MFSAPWVRLRYCGGMGRPPERTEGACEPLDILRHLGYTGPQC